MEDHSRINRLRDRFFNKAPILSIQRTGFFTNRWQELNPGMPEILKTAKSLSRAFEKTGFHLDPEDHLVGSWTEFPSGFPLVLEQKTTAPGLLAGAFSSLPGKADVASLLEKLKKIGSEGHDSPFQAVGEELRIPIRINSRDKATLKKTLLPFWMNVSNHHQRKPSHPVREPPAAGQIDFTGFMGIPFSSPLHPLIPGYGQIIKDGLLKILGNIRRAATQPGVLPAEAAIEVECLELMIAGLMVYSRRLTRKVERFSGFESDLVQERIVDACHRVPFYPARNFFEAVQSFWFFLTAIKLANPNHPISPARLDQLLYSFYKEDLKSGKIKKEEADELLQELLLKMMVYQLVQGSNPEKVFLLQFTPSGFITLGGDHPDGSCAVNPLTYLVMDAAAISKTALKLVLQVNSKTPEKVLQRLSALREKGSSNLVLKD